MTDTPELSLVLPVHDQADHIADVVRGFAAALQAAGLSHEILLVPNGCSDASPAICESLAAELASVRCVPAAAAGWGHAVRRGLAAGRGRRLAYTNAARTRPDDLARIVAAALRLPATQPAVVKAVRVQRERALRRWGSRLYNLECRLLFGLAARDINGTPKVFSRACDGLLGLRQQGDLIDLELLVCSRHRGYPVTEIEIRSDRRHGGRSTTRWRSALRLFRGAWDYWRAQR
jgi:glycosyltransferase involved in cell wall biosynthesis